MNVLINNLKKQEEDFEWYPTTDSMIETIKEQFSIDRESIKLIAARKLGFSRRGAKVDSALSQAVDNLVIARKVTEIGGKISLIE